MEDKESGSLSQKPALDLLVELHRGQVTGSLKLERAPLQKAVYFRDGQILFAASNDPKDQLASILVEEGKLGPDQMQVAQARVSPGNPLAKVLTELGYISQRELADAARIKVEKILTDLYTWKEGTYQFLTKSLPKGAIDLELSTSRLLFASIRRVQDRDWILNQLGSLEAVLIPTAGLEAFIEESHAEPPAADVLRLADGVKTVKQIGSVSSLGEFEVCKILTAALVAGSLTTDAVGTTSSDEAFAFAGDAFSPPPAPPSYGVETVGLPTQESSPDSMSYDTIFQVAATPSSPPPEESERTVFEPGPLRTEPAAEPFRTSPRAERSRPRSSPDLVIDEPEPDLSDELPGRSAPRPRRRGGGGASTGAGGLVKILGALALVGAAGFSVYYFVWPLFGGGGGTPQTTPAATTTTAPATAPAGGAPTGTDPRAAASTSALPTPPPGVTTTAVVAPTPSGTPSPPRPAPPVQPSPTPPAPAPAATTSAPPVAPPGPRPAPPAPPSGAAKPPSGATTAPGGDGGHALLRSGNLSGAARAFQQELQREGANKFTIALGLYCNEENVGRMVESAAGSREIYVLPTLVDGRSCYRVIWGIFDSREAAQRGLGTVPSGVRAGDAAPVAISRFLR